MSKKNNQLADANAPVFGYLQAIYLSFFSRRLYVDVGKRWRGFGFIYLLIITSIFTLPIGIQWTLRFQTYLNTQLLEPITQLPTIYIQNGELNFDKPMPYLIKNAQNQVISVIDTSGKVKPFDAAYPHMVVLITKNTFYFNVPDITKYGNTAKKTPTSFTFEKNDNQVFEPKFWMDNSGLTMIKYTLYILIYPFILALFYSLLVTFMPVMALLGQLFNKIFFDFSVTFKQSCRLMGVASTPALLILFTLLTINYIKSGWGFGVVAIQIAYYSWAILILKRESKYMVIQ